MEYRISDPGRQRELDDHVARQQRELEAFAKALKSRARGGPSNLGAQVLQLPNVFFFFAFLVAGIVTGFALPYVVAPPHGDGMAQLGGLLSALFGAVLGALFGGISYVVFVIWRKRRYGF